VKLEDLFSATPSKREYEKPKDILIPIIQDILEKENLIEYEAKDEPIFRASGIGYCERATLYKMQGYQDIKKFNEVCMLNLGTAMHEVLQGYLKKVPGLVLSMEDELKSDEMPVTAHQDGVLNINGKKYLLEIKTCNVTAFQILTMYPKPYNSHKNQVTMYMKMLGVTDTIFLYVNRNAMFTPEFDKEYKGHTFNPVFLEIHYKFDDNLYSEIKDKVSSMIEHFTNGTMPLYEKRLSECGRCQFLEQCKLDRKEDRKREKN